MRRKKRERQEREKDWTCNEGPWIHVIFRIKALSMEHETKKMLDCRIYQAVEDRYQVVAHRVV